MTVIQIISVFISRVRMRARCGPFSCLTGKSGFCRVQYWIGKSEELNGSNMASFLRTSIRPFRQVLDRRFLLPFCSVRWKSTVAQVKVKSTCCSNILVAKNRGRIIDRVISLFKFLNEEPYLCVAVIFSVLMPCLCVAAILSILIAYGPSKCVFPVIIYFFVSFRKLRNSPELKH